MIKTYWIIFLGIYCLHLQGCQELDLSPPQIKLEEITYEGRWNIEQVQQVQNQTTDGLADTLILGEEWNGVFFFGFDSTGTLTGPTELLCDQVNFEWRIRSSNILFSLPDESFNISANVVRLPEPRTIQMTMDACIPGRGQSQRAIYVLRMKKPGGGGSPLNYWNE